MEPDTEARPDISIVVAICDGGQALRNCLAALAAQEGDQTAEVIVPFDQVSCEAAALADEFPDFRFLDLGVIADGLVPTNALELHRLWDIRRAEALKGARGRFIGLLEDRGIPAPDWAASMLALHRERPAAAIGGCVENGLDTPWNWAVHFCDFGRYLPPHPTAASGFLSATNICYRAEDLMALRGLWEDRFYEPSVHGAFQEAGKAMILSDRPLVTQYRPRIPTAELAAEWYQWGRYFARMRAGTVSAPQRAVRILSAPLLPFVLFLRHRGTARGKPDHADRFPRAAPMVFLLVTMWSLGEFAGYLQGPDLEASRA